MPIEYDITDPNGMAVEILKDIANHGSSLTPLPLALQSNSTLTSPDIVRGSGNSLIIVVTLANRTGVPTYTPSVQMKTKSGAYVTIWTAAAALAANGVTTYALGSASVDATAYTEKKQILIPDTIRIVLTYAGTPATDKVDTLVDLDVV